MPQGKRGADLGATRIRYRRAYLSNNDPEGLVIDHVSNGWIQIFDAEPAGGGNADEFIVDFAVVEPLSDEEVKAYRSEQAAVAETNQAFVERVDEVGLGQAATEHGLRVPQALQRYEQAKAQAA